MTKKKYELSYESDFECPAATVEAVDEQRAVERYVCGAYKPDWSNTFDLYAREVGSTEAHRYDVHAHMTLTVDVRRMRR